MNLGDKMIPFSLPGVDDQVYTEESFADKHILAVIFSCNHCPYVLAWEDRMIQLQEEYATRNVQLVLIGPNDAEKYPADSFANMKTHAAEKGFNFPYLRDESQRIARAYEAERTPEVFLFDSERVLRYHGAIDDNHEQPENVKSPYLRDAIDALLEGQVPATAETPPVGCTIKWK